MEHGIDTGGRSGQIKTLCPRCSATRKKSKDPCLSVNVDMCVWNCWHCGLDGGLKQPGWGSYEKVYKPKTYTKPEYKKTDLPDKVVLWFKERGISELTLQKNNIGHGEIYMPQVQKKVNAIQFPYYNRKGEIINIKYRDGNKNFRMAGGAERILYGLNNLVGSVDPADLIIVEGEMDKLTLDTVEICNTLSIPDGAPSVNTKNYETKFNYLDSEYELFDRTKKVILAVDNDEPGEKLKEELARRIGKEKCYTVEWPDGCKDANDVIVKHSKEALIKIINKAEPYPVEGIYGFRDIKESIKRLYTEGGKRGETTGWKSVDKYYTVKSGELTVVTGVPSHGKSEWIDALIMNLGSAHGWKFGIFSPENRPIERHAQKLIEKYKNKPFNSDYSTRITMDELEVSIELLHDYYKFILPKNDDELTLDSILGLAKVLVFRYGIKGLVIDPYNEMDHIYSNGVSETQYISKFLSTVRKFARHHDVHIWLIAHPTKLYKDKEGNYPIPNPYDISGSAHWRNKADNCLTVWRDLLEPKEPVQIHIQKIRFKEVGEIGMVELNYDYTTGRYVDC